MTSINQQTDRYGQKRTDRVPKAAKIAHYQRTIVQKIRGPPFQVQLGTLPTNWRTTNQKTFLRGPISHVTNQLAYDKSERSFPWTPKSWNLKCQQNRGRTGLRTAIYAAAYRMGELSNLQIKLKKYLTTPHQSVQSPCTITFQAHNKTREDSSVHHERVH